MLSRSNSTAADRVRRAKSTSSHTTTNSGPHRPVTTIDPFVVRQQAEVAAVEAYNRARELDMLSAENQRPIPPKLQRRRSQKGGKTQGSHLEDARLGRRRSTSTKSDGRAPQQSRSRPPTVSEYASTGNDSSAGEERVVTRKRSVIPPMPSTEQYQRQHLSVPHTSHPGRRPASSYGTGSPTPRHPSKLSQRRSTLQLSSTPTYHEEDGYGSSSAHMPDFSQPSLDVQTLNRRKASVHETQTDEDILNMARDKCLQDFQQKKLRERKSFIAPFQRRATAFFTGGGNAYDNSLPPFNYADDTTFDPLPPAPEPLPEVPHAPILMANKQSRNFSDTLKGRIKKAFRRVTKAPPAMPIQHIESTHYHYPAEEDEYATVSRRQPDPFITVTDEASIMPTEVPSDTLHSRSSAGQSNGATSRVTSWANSTVPGTAASRAEIMHPHAVSEHGGLHRSTSQSTLRKASSFLGKPIANKLRRASKLELKSSEESQGLYSALRDRIKPRERTESPELSVVDGQGESLRVPSALSSLPSQAQRASLSKRYSTPTIRSVTPDPSAQRRSICSPVPEVLSPDGAAVAYADYAPVKEITANATPHTAPQRRLPAKAPAPSSEQLQKRMEKSRNRWQAPLDEFSPRPSKAEIEENPYELRSLSQTHPQPPAHNDLPHHAKVTSPEVQHNRAAMLSPSLYSRCTDGASPRPLTPVEQGGMVVTITGREVRSYSISPPKNGDPSGKPVQTSGQWRRWLSDEMGGFQTAEDDFNLAQAFLNGKTAQRSRSVSRQQQEDGGSRPASLSPPPMQESARPSSATASSRRPASSTGRPRASSRRSSFMNERYPMIEPSRNSSDQSVRSRTVSPFARERQESSGEQEAARPTLENYKQRSVFSRPRVVTGRASIAHMESAARNKSPPLSQSAAYVEPLMSGALTSHTAPEPIPATVSTTQRVAKSNKTRSAFDLRANYKSSNNGGRSTPIEIHRKSGTPMNEHTNILEDNTIRNISAGPYAFHALSRNENKENSPPPETAGLPQLSSSEWLAAGPNKARKPSIITIHPAFRSRERVASRYSPPKSPSAPDGYFAKSVGKSESGKGSPAQRMASQWLEKRSRESTPAFV